MRTFWQILGCAALTVGILGAAAALGFPGWVGFVAVLVAAAVGGAVAGWAETR